MNTYLLLILILLLIIIYNKHYDLFYSYNKSDERIINKTDYNNNINILNTNTDILINKITGLTSQNRMNFNKIDNLKENINNISSKFNIGTINDLFNEIQSNITTIYRHNIKNNDPDRQIVI
jgi:hypothetical protein